MAVFTSSPTALLHGDEAPELAGVEVVHVPATEIVQRLALMDGVRSNGSWRML